MSFDLTTGMLTAIGGVVTAIGGVVVKLLHEMKSDQMELGNHKATENTELIVKAITDASEKQTTTLAQVFNAGNVAVISAVRGEHRPNTEA